MRLLAAVHVARSSINQSRPPDIQQRVEMTLDQLRLSVGGAEFEETYQAGSHLLLDDAIHLGRRLGAAQESAA